MLYCSTRYSLILVQDIHSENSITYVTVTFVTFHFQNLLVMTYPKNFEQAFD